MRLAKPLQLALFLVLMFRAGGLDIPMEGMSDTMQIRITLIDVAFKDRCIYFRDFIANFSGLCCKYYIMSSRQGCNQYLKHLCSSITKDSNGEWNYKICFSE